VKLRRALVPLLLVPFAVLLTSCGGDDGDSSAAGSDDATSGAPSSSPTSSAAADGAGVVACDVLTPDVVEAAVGRPVKDGIPSYGPAITGGSFTTCVWQSDDPDHPGDTATVTIYPNADAADSAREDDSQDLDGIGDHAYTGSFASVWVYVGEKSLFAQWYSLSGSDEDNLPKSKALAEAAVDAL
jgi:hypothetical protein